jgi:undecaprenyl-diphosphatase
MDIIQTIIIAIVEGLTEFLPVSSTAHMKFANPLIGVTPTPFTNMFEIVIQLAAILSVVFAYSKKFFDFKHPSFYLKLIVAVIPALVAGALLKKYIDNALGQSHIYSLRHDRRWDHFTFHRQFFQANTIAEENNISFSKAFVIGCFQVLSVLFPGLSRSAATIIGGMTQKLTRNLAAEFSFFLAVPTMFACFGQKFL